MLLSEESVLNVAIYQTEYYLGLVSLGRGLKHVCNYFNLVLLNLRSHRRTAHTISVDDNLIRKCLSLFVEVSDSLIYESLDNLSSLNGSEDLLDLSL